MAASAVAAGEMQGAAASAAAAAAGASATAPATAHGDHDPLVMYIIMRKDLAKAGWSGGSIAAQACHATTAVLAKHWTHPRVVSYLGDLANMHKVVLGVKNLGKLEGLCGQMAEAGIEFERWVEQPENTLTAVATLPQSRSQAVPFFKAAKCELWR